MSIVTRNEVGKIQDSDGLAEDMPLDWRPLTAACYWPSPFLGTTNLARPPRRP